MPRIVRKVLVEAPVERVFEYATTVSRFPHWWTSLVEVRNAGPDVIQEGTSYEYVYKMMGMKLHGLARVTQVEPPRSFVTVHTGDIDAVIRHDFLELGSATEYTLTLDYAPPGPLVDRVADRTFLRHFNEREADQVVSRLKDHCEALPG